MVQSVQFVIEMKPTLQWLTKDMIKYHIKKLNNKNQGTPSASDTPSTTLVHNTGGRTIATASSSVSTLTAASLSSPCDSRQQSFPPLSTIVDDNMVIGRPGAGNIEAYYVTTADAHQRTVNGVMLQFTTETDSANLALEDCPAAPRIGPFTAPSIDGMVATIPATTHNDNNMPANEEK